MGVPTRWTAPLALLLGLALSPAGGSGQTTSQPPVDEKAAFFQRASDSRARGPANALVTVLEIADFQCPVCARFFHEVYPKVDSAYIRPGKVRWVMLNLPLTSHRNAWPAAEAALCAGVAGARFWEMHDRLYITQSTWASADDPSAHFLGLARELGVPEAPYRQCTEQDQVAVVLLQDAMGVVRAGVGGTPSFVVNNDLAAVGMKSFEEWKGILDKAIEEAQAKKAAPKGT
jgi:protein-disulfide isomerase